MKSKIEKKRCSKCHLIKFVYEFPKNKNNIDGIHNWCKECANATNRKNYPKYRERIIEKTKAYGKTKKGRKVRSEATAKFAKENPKKYLAYLAVKQGIKYGIIKIEPCSVCGVESGVEAHHEDYDRPYDVVWMCRKHHREYHRGVLDHLNSQDQEEEYDILAESRMFGRTGRAFGNVIKRAGIIEDTQEEWEKEFENPEGQTYDDPTRIPAEYHKLWESHGVDGYEVLETYPESAFELDPEKVVTFIKQLLEERSFSKEELVWIRNCVKRYGEEIEINEENSKIENAIFEKVNRLYRLLNLNNKRK